MPTTTIIRQAHPTVPLGNVISQSPAAGVAVDPDSVVTLYISLGPDETEVPAIIALDIVAANAAIAAATLVKGAVTYVVNPANLYQITAQNPPATTQVDTGTPVDYTVNVAGTVVAASSRSRGRRH